MPDWLARGDGVVNDSGAEVCGQQWPHARGVESPLRRRQHAASFGETALPLRKRPRHARANRPDAEIYFEEFGRGYPVLLFAPGGLRSRIEMWQTPRVGRRARGTIGPSRSPLTYRVIAMDQRNAGRSPRAAIAADHGWHSYAADQLALMDHLGHRRFHTLGGCIGASFCLKLAALAPERISAAVLAKPDRVQPRGPDLFPRQPSRLEPGAVRGATRSRCGGVGKLRSQSVGRDFASACSRHFVRQLRVPCLVLPGQ